MTCDSMIWFFISSICILSYAFNLGFYVNQGQCSVSAPLRTKENLAKIESASAWCLWVL